MRSYWGTNRTVIATLSIALMISAFSIYCDSNTVSASNIDWIRSCEAWWGVSIDSFPAVAGFPPGQYQQGDNPIGDGSKVIVPAKDVTAAWEPKVLPPSFFKFTSEGLVLISGFYKGNKDEVVSDLTQLYGPYRKAVRVLNFIRYVWVLNRTAFEISDAGYNVFPADKVAQ